MNSSHTVSHRTTLHHNETHCNTLLCILNESHRRHTGVSNRLPCQFNTLEHTAPHRTTPHHTAPHRTTPHCNTLQHTSLHHSTPHHCNTDTPTKTLRVCRYIEAYMHTDLHLFIDPSTNFRGETLRPFVQHTTTN